MSQYLPNLRTLDLSHSIELEKIIDFGEFPNLEWLNLEGCTNLVELDPSIGLLRNLVYLNLENCYNLLSIPNTIFGLGSLEDLNISCCSKVFNKPIHLEKNKKRHYITESASHSPSTSSVFEWTMLPHHSSFSAPTTHTSLLPSLRSLHCLRKIDISFCYLRQVPGTIECLHWLERLNLGGNDFVTLPSLRKLSKLVYLNLEHCRLLESLPQLPSHTSLGRDHLEKEYKWNTGLVIFNCPKLGERERCSSMTFSWMTQFIQAYQQSYPTYLDEFQIVTPGCEIPSWINNQSMGDSMPVDQTPIMHDNNNNIIGFLCCVVFSMTPSRRSNIDPRSIYMEIGGTRKRIWLPVRVAGMFTDDLITRKSCHLWLIYLPRESYQKFEGIKIVGGMFLGNKLSGMEVKSCGYHWVCKQDLQEFNLTMMNHEKSLASKRKILAIEDETQPQPEQVITSDNKSTAKTIFVVNRKQRY